MAKGNLTTKEYKRLIRLKRELKEMEEWAYKYDMDESKSVAGERLNTRYQIAVKEATKLLEKR